MDDAERARSLADGYWEDLLALEPMLGTMIGDPRYDDRLSDPGEAGRARTASVSRAALDELSSIDRSALDITMRGTLDVLEAIARRSLAEIEQGNAFFNAIGSAVSTIGGIALMTVNPFAGAAVAATGERVL